MDNDSISPVDPYRRHRMILSGADMAYVDTGMGDPIVFLHGNPTSSYLWRNVIPHLETLGRCLAPDLIGMGDSTKAADGSYNFADHSRYLDQWFDTLGLTERITLVGHDWGGALGFHWAHRHALRVKGIAYMETIVRPLTWEEWPESSRSMFQAMRSPEGNEMVLERNLFIERILPASVLRGLTLDEMNAYRRPFTAAGESRRPTLTWPRQIPLNGEPVDVVAVVNGYARWLNSSTIPKLFINADPGAILVGDQREFCRSWPNQREVTVKGSHFIQEDSPNEIGQAISEWYKLLQRSPA